MADDKSTKTDVTTEDLARQVEVLRADVAALTSALGAYGRSQGERARTAASDSVEHARLQAEEHAARLRRQAEQAQGQADAFVRDQPGAALGLAVGLGFLVGLLLGRR